VCSLSVGALGRKTLETRGLSAPFTGNGSKWGWGVRGTQSRPYTVQPHTASMVEFEAGLEDPCFPDLFSLLHNIPSPGTYSFGLHDF